MKFIQELRIISESWFSLLSNAYVQVLSQYVLLALLS